MTEHALIPHAVGTEHAELAGASLDDILAITQATESDGVTLYFPDPVYNSTTSYGLELDGTLRLTERWSVRSVFTAQKAKNDIDAAWEGVKGAKHPRIHTFLATSDIHLQHKLRISRPEMIARASSRVNLSCHCCRKMGRAMCAPMPLAVVTLRLPVPPPAPAEKPSPLRPVQLRTE